MGKILSKTSKVLIIISLLLFSVWFFFARPEVIIREGGKECSVNQDCISVGRAGTSFAGCYNKEKTPIGLPTNTRLAKPSRCVCEGGRCVVADPLYD